MQKKNNATASFIADSTSRLSMPATRRCLQRESKEEKRSMEGDKLWPRLEPHSRRSDCFAKQPIAPFSAFTPDESGDRGHRKAATVSLFMTRAYIHAALIAYASLLSLRLYGLNLSKICGVTTLGRLRTYSLRENGVELGARLSTKVRLVCSRSKDCGRFSEMLYLGVCCFLMNRELNTVD